MRRKLMLIIPGLIVFVAALYVFAYFYVGRSPAYAAAIDFLSNHNHLKMSVGNASSYKLAYTGWALSFFGPKGEAHFKIYVNGTKSSGTVFVYLVSQAGQWKVKEANLFPKNGESIPLQP